MSDQAKTLSIVHALLAKVADGSGCTEEEARTAAVQACRLILRHKLLDAAARAPGACRHGNALGACWVCELEAYQRGDDRARARARTSSTYACLRHTYHGEVPCPSCNIENAARAARAQGGCPRHSAHDPTCPACRIIANGGNVPPNPTGDSSRRRREPMNGPCVCPPPTQFTTRSYGTACCSRCGGEPVDSAGRTAADRAAANAQYEERVRAEQRRGPNAPADMRDFARAAAATAAGMDGTLFDDLFQDMFKVDRKTRR